MRPSTWAAVMVAGLVLDVVAIRHWIDAPPPARSRPDVEVRALLELPEPPRPAPTEAGTSAPAPTVEEGADLFPPPPPGPGAIELQLVAPAPLEVTTGDLYEALARSSWPRTLWPSVVAIARCEARHGAGVDLRAEGDGGRSLGVLQINVTAHPDLARAHDLRTLEGALEAGWVVYQRSDGFGPWSCA